MIQTFNGVKLAKLDGIYLFSNLDVLTILEL